MCQHSIWGMAIPPYTITIVSLQWINHPLLLGMTMRFCGKIDDGFDHGTRTMRFGLGCATSRVPSKNEGLQPWSSWRNGMLFPTKTLGLSRFKLVNITPLTVGFMLDNGRYIKLVTMVLKSTLELEPPRAPSNMMPDVRKLRRPSNWKRWKGDCWRAASFLVMLQYTM